jgi:alpha-glucosidase
MPWSPSPTLGFTTGQPWLPAAPEHADLTVEAQTADDESTLTFARQMIALRKSSPAMTTGDLQFLGDDDSVLAFVRREGGEAIACVFNLSAEPRVFADPAIEDAELLWLRTGEADLRGGSIGLSPHAAVFLRLP